MEALERATRVATPPSEEPLSLAEAREHLRVDDSLEDPVISRAIAAARQFAEAFLHRKLCTTGLELQLSGFPSGQIDLPFPPLQAAASVTYVDTAGEEQELLFASGDFQADTVSEPGRIYPCYGQSWPTPRSQPAAVTVAFTAGYGAASAVPDQVKQAMLLHVGALYADREAAEVPEATKNLLWPLRSW